MKKMTNKKYLLIPISIILMVTMFMTPMTNAQIIIVPVNKIISFYNVDNPNNVIGPPDNSFAHFKPPAAQMTIKVTGSTPTSMGIYAFPPTGTTTTINIYSSSNPTGPWTYIGSTIINSGPAWHQVYIPVNCQYITIATFGDLYIDSINII